MWFNLPSSIDDLHASKLFLLLVATLGVVFYYRAKNLNRYDWVGRLSVAGIAGAITWFTVGLFTYVFGVCSCNQYNQGIIAGLLVVVVLALTKRTVVTLVYCVFLYFAGMNLGFDFLRITNSRDLDGNELYTGANCNFEGEIFTIHGKREVKYCDSRTRRSLWHTFLTGIYLKK